MLTLFGIFLALSRSLDLLSFLWGKSGTELLASLLEHSLQLGPRVRARAQAAPLTAPGLHSFTRDLGAPPLPRLHIHLPQSRPCTDAFEWVSGQILCCFLLVLKVPPGLNFRHGRSFTLLLVCYFEKFQKGQLGIPSHVQVRVGGGPWPS